MMVFSHKKCLSWYHKYTNDVGELGIYKIKVQFIFVTFKLCIQIIICRAGRHGKILYGYWG